MILLITSIIILELTITQVLRALIICREGGREGGRDGGREGGREREREKGKEAFTTILYIQRALVASTLNVH